MSSLFLSYFLQAFNVAGIAKGAVKEIHDFSQWYRKFYEANYDAEGESAEYDPVVERKGMQLPFIEGGDKRKGSSRRPVSSIPSTRNKPSRGETFVIKANCLFKLKYYEM